MDHTETYERLMKVAESAVRHSGGRLRMAFNEQDETKLPEPEAAHFLKLDGRRFGRDIELYRVMAMVASPASAVADFAGLVIGLKLILPDAYAAAARELMALGDEIYEPSIHADWHALFYGVAA